MTETTETAPDSVETDLRARLAAQPDDIEAIHALAVYCAEHGRHAEAIGLMAKALDLRPNDLRLRLVAAGVHANAGDLPAAEKDYRTALTMHPNLSAAGIGLGQVAEVRGDTRAAEQHYRGSLQDEPDNVEGLLGLGRVLLGQGHAEEAVQIFGHATQLYPQHARALANYGQALLLRGTPQFACRPLIRALELDDSLNDARLLLGHAELGRGDPVEAEKAYRDVLQRVPSIVACVGLGDALRAQGRYEAALQPYSVALKNQPDNDGLVASHALCLARANRGREAVAELREFITRFPAAASSRLLLADICNASGHGEEALAMWREGAARDANDSLAHAELALTLEVLGKYDEAAAASVGSEGDVRPVAALLRARVAVRGGDWAKAQKELLAINPKPLPASMARDRYRLLGLVHDHNGRYAEATLAFREAQRVDAVLLPKIADPTELKAALAPVRDLPVLATPRLAAPVLLLGLPGSGVERVAALLADQPGVALREDRFAGDLDLFGDGDETWMLMPLPQQRLAVQAKRYQRGVERAFGGLPPLVVDWIPCLDGRVIATARRALPGLRMIVVDAEPEEAFLNWLAFGYQERFRIAEPVDAARWWHAAQGQIDLAAELLPALHVKADALLADPADAGQALADFLAIAPLKLGPHAAQRNGPAIGLPTRFPAGHAAAYRDVLGAAFSALV